MGPANTAGTASLLAVVLVAVVGLVGIAPPALAEDGVAWVRVDDGEEDPSWFVLSGIAYTRTQVSMDSPPEYSYQLGYAGIGFNCDFPQQLTIYWRAAIREAGFAMNEPWASSDPGSYRVHVIQHDSGDSGPLTQPTDPAVDPGWLQTDKVLFWLTEAGLSPQAIHADDDPLDGQPQSG